MKEWLTYIASDELEGRAVFSEGLGLAAGYIQGHLQSWGVKPAGDHGTYIQTVRVLGVKATSQSTVTVRVGGESRTFKDGEGITFPRRAGGKRSLVVDDVEFAGYGLDAPGAEHLDFQGRKVEGAAVVFLGANGPKGLDDPGYRLLLSSRPRYATDQLGALATIGPPSAAAAGGRAGGAGGPTGGATGTARSPAAPNVPDFTTTQRLDSPVAPTVSGTDAFFEFLFSKAPVDYDELKRRAGDQASLPEFRLEGVTLTFNINVDYTVVRTQLTQNVVALIEGSDPQLKSSYVAFGAHYDHLGYAESELADGRRPSPPGKVTPGTDADRIWNGADDDGSGTVGLMALARAFAQGPRPKRIAALCLARRRRARIVRLALLRGLSDRAARQDRGAAEHRHDRAKS